MSKVLSLFSGVGGFDLGLENAGMETVFQCEWDKHCRTVLDRHWATVPKWGDIATLTGKHILAHAPVIDVVAWGSPCQDLSVAGKRAGLEGGRSGLFYEGIRIINELRKASDGKYPRISIWENVCGALNSNEGKDFEAILQEMVKAGAIFCEWRVLDAQYFGIPQRRRRVFVIAVFDSATASRSPDPLLPVTEGLRWNPKTGATARQETASTTTTRIGGRSARLERLARRGSDIVAINPIGFSHTQGLDAQPSETAFPTLRKEGNGHAVLTTMAVRKLTPLECERLMGLPDNWTAGQPDTHRYKQCGNSVASPVAQWIGEQINKVLMLNDLKEKQTQKSGER